MISGRQKIRRAYCREELFFISLTSVFPTSSVIMNFSNQQQKQQQSQAQALFRFAY